MIMVSLPILTTSELSKNGPSSNANSGSKVSERTQYITTSRNLLISGADAVERLMSSYKEIVGKKLYNLFNVQSGRRINNLVRSSYFFNHYKHYVGFTQVHLYTCSNRNHTHFNCKSNFISLTFS